MRTIIKNKVYDTDTARKLAEWESTSSPTGSPRYESERLFRKKTGEYFLHCLGGPDTKYAKLNKSGIFASGERILPLTYDTARDWVKKRRPDEYEQLFGLPSPEMCGEAIVNATISATAKAKLDHERSRTGETVAQVLTRLLDTL